MINEKQRFNKDFNKALERCCSLIEQVVPNSTQGLSESAAYTLSYVEKSDSGEDVIYLGLSRGEAEEYFSCLRQIQDGLAEKHLYDENTIHATVESAFVKAVDPTGSRSHIPVKKRINFARNEIKTALLMPPTKWEVYQQVEGFYLPGLPMKVGGILFYVPTKARQQRIINASKSITSQRDDKEDEDRIVSYLKDCMKEYFCKGALAKVHVVAVTKKAARAQALRELRNTLDVINFFADTITATGNGAELSLIMRRVKA